MTENKLASVVNGHDSNHIKNTKNHIKANWNHMENKCFVRYIIKSIVKQSYIMFNTR